MSFSTGTCDCGLKLMKGFLIASSSSEDMPISSVSFFFLQISHWTGYFFCERVNNYIAYMLKAVATSNYDRITRRFTVDSRLSVAPAISLSLNTNIMEI